MWVKRVLPNLEGDTDFEGNPLSSDNYYWSWEGEGPPPPGMGGVPDDSHQEIAEIIGEQEAKTSEPSPLRKVPVEPVQGVDQAPDRLTDPILDEIFGPSAPVHQALLPEYAPAPKLDKSSDYLARLALNTSDLLGTGQGMVRQGGAGFAQSLITAPWDLTAAIGSTSAIPAQKLGMEGPARLVESMQQTSQKNKALIESLAGEPKGILERGSKVVGGSYVPGSLPATALIAGTQLGLEHITSPAGAAPVAQAFPQTSPIHQALIDKNSVRIETVGGPAVVSTDDLKSIGGAALISLGMIFAPKLFSRFSKGPPPMRPVKDAAPGTVALSSNVDLARTYDDVNAGALRIARKAGVDPVALENLYQVFRIQTRSTTNALTDAAVRIGRMTSPSYQMNIPTSLGRLIKVETQPVRDYLHVLDAIDEIKIRSQISKNMKNPQTVTPVVLGMDLAQATQVKRSIEAAHPEVKDIAKAYRQNLRQMRGFESSGEYATIPKRDAYNVRIQHRRSQAHLNANRPNEVPWPGGRVTGDPVERGSAIESLSVAMRERLRARMENEAVGMYVDEMRKRVPGSFVRVKDEQLLANPNWGKNVVEFKRRGYVEKYTTDPYLADVLTMDPYYMSGMATNSFYMTKRLLEMTTTGELAPWFAVTSMLRSWQISKLTAKEGMKSATLAGSFAAIPAQLYPQMARAFSDRLNAGSGGWLGSVFGPANMQAWSTRLAQSYDRSLYAHLEAAGGGRGSIMQQQTQANSKLAAAIDTMKGPHKAALEGYRALLNAVHNAPAYSMAQRNAGKIPASQLAADIRHMTGDPRVGGQYGVGSGRFSRPIRMEGKSRVSHTIARTYGVATELSREMVPWYNAATQGIKRVGEAYLDNPAKFTGRMWLYQIAPSVSLYLYARSLGNDPNGVSYVDHMMNRRGPYRETMNFYIPIPGRPAADGVEAPRVHEFSLGGRLAEVAMDHATRSNLFPYNDSMLTAAGNVLQVFEPPIPPLLALLPASLGIVTPQGPFSGEAYRRYEEPFNQFGGLPSSVEMVARAMAAGLADIVGSSAAAYTNTEEGFHKKIWNATKAGLGRVVTKVPVVNTLTGMQPPLTGNTDLTEELFKKQRAIRDLERHYRKWVRNEGQIGKRPRSYGGEIVAKSHLGERPPTESAGINQPAPSNPLYERFMELLHTRLIKDAPWTGTPKQWAAMDAGKRSRARVTPGTPTGALGLPSMWGRYGIATENLRRLNNVNIGNTVTWHKQMANRPGQAEYLRRNGVDPYDLRQVKNFYQTIRHNTARVILFQIKGVEQEISDAVGRPITLEDINPYKKGFEEPEPYAPGPVEGEETEQ